MIVRHWPKWFVDKIGGSLPRTYACMDTETTGFKVDSDPVTNRPADLITEIGHVLVVDGEVTDKGSWTVNWTTDPMVSREWLRARIAQQEHDFRNQGLGAPTSYRNMAETGVEPKLVFSFYKKWLDELRAAKIPLVLHNGYRFDEAMLNRAFLRTRLDPAFSFGSDWMIDTQSLEVASEAYARPDIPAKTKAKCLPAPDDTLRSYCERQYYLRAPVGSKPLVSKLATHCFVKYGFDKHGVTPEAMHGAEVDAYCTHLMMEAWTRELAGTAPPVRFESQLMQDPPAPATQRQAPKPKAPVRYRGTRIT